MDENIACDFNVSECRACGVEMYIRIDLNSNSRVIHAIACPECGKLASIPCHKTENIRFTAEGHAERMEDI